MPAKPAIQALTGLRFFAALFVALHHFGQLIDYPYWLALLLRHGVAGVTFFFVLSGFVLTYNYYDRFSSGLSGYGDFLWARMARIGPMHLLTHLAITPFTLLVLASNHLVSPTTAAVSWLSNLFLVQAYVPVYGFQIWNTPAWSLCNEAFFYLLLPVLIRGLLVPLGRRQPPLRLATGVYWLGGVVVLATVWVDARLVQPQNRSSVMPVAY